MTTSKAFDFDKNIRMNSVFKEFPNEIWSKRKRAFVFINRDPADGRKKDRRGFLVTHDDLVYVVGDSSFGLLGLEQNQMTLAQSYHLNLKLSYLAIEDIQMGGAIAAARSATGKLLVWGSGLHGIVQPELELRQGRTYGRYSAVPTTIVHHSCGSDHVMAVTTDGQLVHFSPRSSSETSKILLHKMWPDLNLPAFNWCGSTHGAAFALTDSGKLYSWGRNKHAELGRLTETKVEQATGPFRNYKLESLPQLVEIPSGLTIEKVECGISYAAALTCCGKLYLWGRNLSGVLGDGNEPDEYVFLPKLVTHFRIPVTAITMPKFRPVVVCQLNNGKVYAWGALNRRLKASTPEPVRTPFLDVTTALIHFDTEFRESWELKGDENMRTPSRQENLSHTRNDNFMQSLLSRPSVSTFIPSTPVYGSSTHVPSSSPMHVPGTPLHAPSSPLFAPSSPFYGTSSPLIAPSSPFATLPTPAYAPSTPMYSEDYAVLDYNHGASGTPLYDDRNPSPPQRSPSPLSRAMKATLAAQPPPPPPERRPISPLPPPPPQRPSAVTIALEKWKARNLQDQYNQFMKSLNPSPAQTATANVRTKRPLEARTINPNSRPQTRHPATTASIPSLMPDNLWIDPPPPPAKKPRFSDVTAPPPTFRTAYNATNRNRTSKNVAAAATTSQPHPTNFHTKTFSVSSSAASAVIGHGGGNIRLLTQRTHATIKVLGNRRAYQQLVQICGRTPEIVQRAYDEVQEIISQYECHRRNY